MAYRNFDRKYLQHGYPHYAPRIIEHVPNCWFCDTDLKGSNEHIFAKSLLKLLNLEKQKVAPSRYSTIYNTFADKRQEMPLTSVVCGEICEKCNNGWMSQLEIGVQDMDILTPRKHLDLNADEAKLLSRWGTKIAICLNISMPSRLLFDYETRHALVNSMPKNVSVYI